MNKISSLHRRSELLTRFCLESMCNKNYVDVISIAMVIIIIAVIIIIVLINCYYYRFRLLFGGRKKMAAQPQQWLQWESRQEIIFSKRDGHREVKVS